MSETTKTQQNEQRKYVEYLKTHHTLLIACISAIVTIISFWIGLLSHVYQKIILEEYNVPLDIINTTNHGRLFYYVLMSIAFYAINPLIQESLMKVFLKYYRRSAIDKLLRVKLRDDEDKKKEAAFKHILDKDRRGFIKSLLLGIFALIILFLLVYLAYSIVASSFSASMIVCWFVLCVINVVFARMMAIKKAGEYGPRRIRECVRAIENEEDEKKKIEIFSPHLEKLLSLSIDDSLLGRKKLTDDKVLEYLLTIAVSIVAVTLLVIASGYIEAKTRNTFWILPNEDTSYAMVYQNPEMLVLEEAIIDSETITIIRNKQRYMKFDDVEFERKTFKLVIKEDEEIKTMQWFENTKPILSWAES